MATFTIARFPNIEVSITYEDATFNVSYVQVTNNSDSIVTITVNKLDNPKRTFAQTFQPHTTIGYSVPKGYKFSLDPIDQNLSMPYLEILIGCGQ